MKTIIAGSRGFQDIQLVEQACSRCGWDITEVVSGGARGIDRLGEEWAKRNGIPIKQFIPEWNNDKGHFVKSAGIHRNMSMGKYADALIAIWDGESKGTEHMISYMRSLGKRLFLYYPAADRQVDIE